jgi:hypothetical protein
MVAQATTNRYVHAWLIAFSGLRRKRSLRFASEIAAPTRFHQSYIEVFEVPVFLGMRMTGWQDGRMLWLHEGDTPAFEVIYISETPRRGRHGVAACPIPRRGAGVPRHSIAMSDLLLGGRMR